MTIEARRPLVLAVDDEEQILVSIDDLLEDDFEVRTATSGTQGLEKLQKDHYAVIVTDQRMPEMTGDEFLLRARELSGASRILLTGYADHNALQRAVNHGKIFAYVPKPWDPAALKETIRDAAKHYQLIRDMEGNRDRKISLDAARAGVWSWNIQTDRVVWDMAMERLHGLETDSFRGDHAAWIELIHPEDRALFGAAAERSIRTEVEFDVVLRSKRFPADWRYLHMQAIVVRDERNEPLRLTGLSTDITERKRDEELLRRTTEELRQTAARQRAYLVQIEKQKRELERRTEQLGASNRELETLAVVAAHDLKEPLRTISFHASILEESLGDRITNDEREQLNSLRALIVHLSDMIDALLRYMHLGRTEIELVRTDLNEVVSESLRLLSVTLNDANGTVTLLDRLPAAMCNRNLIREVFHNLILNAVKYNDQPEKRIEIGVAAPHSDTSPNQTVIRVRDNGIGIEPHCAERVFEMFRRLHGQGEFGGGSGVGLAWAKRIVELHGGEIWLESRPGEGSDFYFSLELAPELS
jgi:signal transduction histidine kinase